MPTANPARHRFLAISAGYFFTSITLFMLCLVAGCRPSPNSVEATTRSSPYSAVLTADSGTPRSRNVSSEQLALARMFPFVTDDHVVCLRLNVNSIRHSPQFSDFDWTTLERQMSRLLGSGNSDLDTITALWLLVDGNELGTIGAENVESPVVYVLQRKIPIDDDSWESAAVSRRDTLAGNHIDCQLLDQTNIAWGDTSALSRLTQNAAATPPAIFAQIESWNLEHDICGALRFESIRPVLQPWATMLGRMLPNAEKFVELPEALNAAVLSVDLNAAQMAKLDIDIQKADSFLEATRSLLELMSGSANGVMGGTLTQLANPSVTSKVSMIDSVSEGPLENVGREINEGNLFSVTARDNLISMSLERPESIDTAIKALVRDMQNQLALNNRVKRYGKIATALADYAENYGQLPPPGHIDQATAETMGIPPQFNWRVGILSSLGMQQVYDKFDFSKTWDASENQSIGMPDVFDDGGPAGESYLRLNANPVGFFQDAEVPPQVSDFRDPLQRTALAIQSASSQPWLRPVAIDEPQIDTADFGAPDENGVLFISGDYQVKAVKKEETFLRAVITTDGGEKQSRSDFISLPPTMPK